MAASDPNAFNIAEHYKMNSHIFKQNLMLISNIIIDDLWVNFNAIVQEQQQTEQHSNHSLERIEELSTEQIANDSTPVNAYLTNEEPNTHHHQARNNSKRINEHVQEYKDQLAMIRQRQELDNSQRNLNASRTSQSSKSNANLSHGKTPSMLEQNLSPSQQNYKTMQYLSQYMSRKEEPPLLQPAHQQIPIAYTNLRTKPAPKDPQYEKHVVAIQQHEQFHDRISKQKSASKRK